EKAREQARRYHATHKEEIKTQRKLFYGANRERLLEQKRQYLIANKEEINRRRKKWREANKEKNSQRNREQYNKNREQRKENQRRYNVTARGKINEKLTGKRLENPAKYREANRRWYMAHPDDRHKITLKKYNLTPEEYASLLAAQNGLCAICSKPEIAKEYRTGKVKRLTVDHCHKSGAVRGLLCVRCNVGLGLIESLGPDGLERIAAYLGKYERIEEAA